MAPNSAIPMFYWLMFGWYEPLLALGGCVGALLYPKEVRHIRREVNAHRGR